MKKIYFLLIALTGLFLFQSCSDTETYAEKKEKENAAINQYIADKKIQVISEEELRDAIEKIKKSILSFC